MRIPSLCICCGIALGCAVAKADPLTCEEVLHLAAGGPNQSNLSPQDFDIAMRQLDLVRLISQTDNLRVVRSFIDQTQARCREPGNHNVAAIMLKIADDANIPMTVTTMQRLYSMGYGPLPDPAR
jgi:hypothetical protein